MLSHIDLALWYGRLGLSEAARALIERIRSSEPARRVGGGKSNVAGRYPSRKMGRIVQFESHRLEFAVALELEDDERVLEYYDQPCQIPLTYRAISGRRISVMHTPDFLVLRSDSAGWEECKTDEQLAALAQKSPHRYQTSPDGTWRCLPGEDYAASFGLYYRIRPSSQIDWVLQRNLCFLDDYLRGDSGGIDSREREFVTACVSANPGIELDELMRKIATPTAADCVHSMIARKEIYVDLKAALLTNPSAVHVFPDSTAGLGSEATRRRGGTVVDLGIGSVVEWDGAAWRVANMGESTIALVGAARDVTELPVAALERLIGEGRIVVSAADRHRRTRDTIQARLAVASERDLKVANRRFLALRARKTDGTDPDVSARTLRSWAALYRQAQEAYGDGYVGLLPEVHKRGNRRNRICEDVRTLMQQSIDDDFGNAKQKSKYTCWIALKHACEQHGLAVPSYRAYRRALQKRSQYAKTLKRKGHRAAYEFEPPYWNLEAKTPRHGDRPLEIGHIDHTELDVELRSTATDRALGRPWMTLLVDAFSRRILAIHLTFDPPSYRSCMMVLRDCVRRHSRFPQMIVADGGREFESTYFETLLARYESTKKTRPPAKPKFGSVVERLFGTANEQFVHNLRGNTQITRNVRQVTRSFDPKGVAAWSLQELNERLNEYLFEVYDQMEHPALGQSPREAFTKGLEAGGWRLQRIIPYNHDFILCTMPSTRTGVALICPSRGVKINYVYYWSDVFRDPELERLRVPVRYDPFDAGTAYAFCRNRWVECHSEYYATLRGRSEREMMIATKEILSQHRRHSQERLNVNAKALAVFLESVEAQESLMIQRARDRESSAMRSGRDAQEEARNATVSCSGGASPPDRSELYGEF